MDEQDIPIDINISKLLEWLTSRRHINKDWQNNILKVREKINNAIQDMPAHDGILKLLSGQHINYFHCLKIIEILKETEADTKNLFGRYGSQRMKDWQDIVSSYQKDNLYLAEASQVIVRNVTYELPSLKKQILKVEQNQAECEKKIKDYTKTEGVVLKEFTFSCEQLGISRSTKNIKSELLKLVSELPTLYREISEKIKIVKPAIELYVEFNKYLSGKTGDVQVLNALQYLIETGNTTTYQYKYGQVPVQIIEASNIDQHSVSGSVHQNEGDIDFVDNGGGIDFGENVEVNFGENGAEIDFGDNGGEVDFGINIESYDITSGNTNSSSSNGEDEFEIVTHDDLKSNFEESGIVVEHTGNSGGKAMGEEALTVLDNPHIQEQIINNLIELSAFLKMRLFELSSDSNLLAVSQMQDAPTVLQMQTLETIATLNDCINVALGQLTNKRIQHLHNIKHSPKYIDILTANLIQKVGVIEKMKASKVVLEDKIKNLQKEIRNTEPIVKKLIEYSKQLQKEIENDISNKYKGRVVNLVGLTSVL